MSRTTQRTVRPFLAAAALAACATVAASGTASQTEAAGDVEAALDRIVLTDGRELVGRVLDSGQVEGEVILEITAGSLVTTLDIPAETIAEVQSKVVPYTPEPEPKYARPAHKAPAAGTGGTRYITIPIEGRIGIDATDLDRPAVAAAAVEATLRNAVHRGVEHVVFTVDAPGGHVSEARAIAEAMRRYDHELTYHALVTRSLSAAMWVTLGCDTVHVRQGATMGGALTYTSAGGAAQYDAKVNGIVAAELASMATTNGRCAETVRSMVEPDNGRVLTLTCAQALEKGLADGRAGACDALGGELGHDEWNEAGSIGATQMRRAQRRLIIEERKRQRDAEDLIEELQQAAYDAERISASVNLARQVEPNSSRPRPDQVNQAIGYWRDVRRLADSIGDAYRHADRDLKRYRRADIEPVFQPNLDRDIQRVEALVERINQARLQVERANADAEAAIVRLRRML